MSEESPQLIGVRKTNFLQYFSYFESEKLRRALLDRIEIKRAGRLKEVFPE